MATPDLTLVSEATLPAHLEATLTSAKGYADTKKNEAITAAAADATTKANQAEADAIADATAKYGGLPQRMTDVEAKNTAQDQAIIDATWAQGSLGPTSPVNGPIGSLKDGGHRVWSDSTAATLSLPGGKAGWLIQSTLGDFGIHIYSTLLGMNVRLWSSATSSWGSWVNPANVYTDAVMETVKWYRGGLLATTPINGPLGSIPDSEWRATTPTRAVELGLPDGAAGDFKQISSGTFGMHFYKNMNGDYFRSWNSETSTWGGWINPAKAYTDAAIAIALDKAKTIAADSPSSGTKLVPLALTLGQGNTDYPVTSGTSRLPMQWGAPISRFRVHIRNINPRENFVRTGEVTFSEGLWLGVDETGDGQATGLKQIVGAFTTPANGDGWVSGWVEEDLPADSKHLLSYSFTATGTVQSCEGGSWRAVGDGLVASSNAATWTRSLDAPFDIWIEAETPSTVPVVAVVGDSLSAGTTATMPVLDSPMSQHMRAWGGLPIHYAAVGDTFNSYNGNGAAGSEDYKKERWLHLAKPDSVLLALGSNDLFGQAQPLASMQSRFNQTLSWVKSALSETVFLSTITPRNLETGATEDERRAYNTWLKQQNQPGGVARAVFDFSAAISSDNETINAEFNGDGIHLNTAGYAAEAAVLKNLTSPAVMYRG